MVQKNSLLDGKRRSKTLKGKDISFLNDVISVFLAPLRRLPSSKVFYAPGNRFLKRAY